MDIKDFENEMAANKAKPVPEAEPATTVKEFLESVPPRRKVRLADVQRKWSPGSGVGAGSYYLAIPIPQLSLYCDHSSCDRIQNFKSTGSSADHVIRPPSQNSFLEFFCRNCVERRKTFALRFYSLSEPDADKVFGFKFGEIPQFGPPLSAKLLQLAGTHGELLKKGRQSENQSLGIGAFAYYRRVVEMQKSRLIDELKNAIERLGGNPKAIAALESARSENQFSNALEQMADVTPKELFVSGQNPLKLLHRPLSVGLHGLTDEECLKKAHSIRVVLTALLERVQMVTEEKSELDAAIKDLLPPVTQQSDKSQ